MGIVRALAYLGKGGIVFSLKDIVEGQSYVGRLKELERFIKKEYIKCDAIRITKLKVYEVDKEHYLRMLVRCKIRDNYVHLKVWMKLVVCEQYFLIGSLKYIHMDKFEFGLQKLDI